MKAVSIVGSTDSVGAGMCTSTKTHEAIHTRHIHTQKRSVNYESGSITSCYEKIYDAHNGNSYGSR